MPHMRPSASPCTSSGSTTSASCTLLPALCSFFSSSRRSCVKSAAAVVTAGSISASCRRSKGGSWRSRTQTSSELADAEAKLRQKSAERREAAADDNDAARSGRTQRSSMVDGGDGTVSLRID